MEKKQEKEEILKKKIFSKDFILHILISSFLFVIFIWDRIVNIPKFPKNFLFLTQIDLYINMIYYFQYLYYNFKKQKENKEKIHLLFNFNFCLSLVVFIMYWAMFILDRETLYKKNSKNIAPFSLNILLHGGVFIVNLFEIFLVIRKQKVSYVKTLFFLIFTIVYVGMLYLVKYLFNIKIYPFIYGSIFKLIFVICCAFGVCLFGQYIYINLTKSYKPKSKEKNFQELEMN